ncbi:MAG: hypothetical protein OEU93_00275 [Rubrivivax sp.]|nr:hypothetical protein [Rubrivivax sp.]
MKSDPVPFELWERDGFRCASNGKIMLCMTADGGTVKRRRGIKGIGPKPPAEVVLPMLNQLAGDLLARLDMPSDELAARVAEIAAKAHAAQPEHVEWAVGEIDGVRVYLEGSTVMVTRQDLMP